MFYYIDFWFFFYTIKKGTSSTSQISEKRKTTPHMYNLNMDQMLCGHIVHFFEAPETTIGNGREESTELVLKGPG